MSDYTARNGAYNEWVDGGRDQVLALPDLPADIGRRLVEEHLLDPQKFWLPVPPPSVAASDVRFSRRDRFLGLRRYWRGPTWLNAAWLLWLGLVRLGYAYSADEMTQRLAATVAREGLREYYDPYSGDGMGARDFSWSALVMEMIDPDPMALWSHLPADALPASSIALADRESGGGSLKILCVTLPLTGGCNCGAVRFEITEPLFGARYCHCTRCQRRTGTAASANAAVVPGSFRIVSGESALKAWEPPDGHEKWFCGECGSAIFTRDPNDHTKTGVRLGAIDGDPGIRPEFRQFVAYAAPWEPIPDDGLPRYPERPSG